jgi:hypothetical protein
MLKKDDVLEEDFSRSVRVVLVGLTGIAVVPIRVKRNAASMILFRLSR